MKYDDIDKLNESIAHLRVCLDEIDAHLCSINERFNKDRIDFRHPASVDRITELASELARVHANREGHRIKWCLLREIRDSLAKQGGAA